MYLQPPMNPAYYPGYNNSYTVTRQVNALHREVEDLTMKLEEALKRIETLEKK